MVRMILGLSLIASQSAFAEGIFTLRGQGFSTLGNYAPEFGLWVKEPIVAGLHYRSWTGVRPGLWYSTQQEVTLEVWPGTSIGVGPSWSGGQSPGELRMGVSLEHKLW